MKLNFFGQIWGNLGVPNHTRAFIRGIQRNDIKVNIIPMFSKIAGGETANYDIDDSITKSLGRGVDINAPALCFWYPESFATMLGIYPKNIGYFIFEYTKFPKLWVDELNKLDIVCTASKWGVEVLKQNGVISRCVVVPGGVDVSKYKFNPTRSGPFRFLHVGKYEARKSTIELLIAFNEAFQGNPEVRLTLMCDNLQVGKTSVDVLNDLKGSFKYPTTNIDPISFVDDLVYVYNTHHCAVFPTKAEGIGLPITEAMACGLPTIASYNSGTTEFLNDQNAILLTRGREAQIYDKNFFPTVGERGVWQSPDINEIIQKMVWVKENYEKAFDIGANASTYMRENFTWDRVGKIFKEEVLSGT
jgi:glycosyltransferase involved in cell wall biosynthesis